MTIAITRHEPGAGELRREAARCRDARAARRMLALALVLEGSSREEAARAAGMDRQTLRDWVHRYSRRVRRTRQNLSFAIRPSRRTSSGSRTASGPGAASTTRWTRWWSG